MRKERIKGWLLVLTIFLLIIGLSFSYLTIVPIQILILFFSPTSLTYLIALILFILSLLSTIFIVIAFISILRRKTKTPERINKSLLFIAMTSSWNIISMVASILDPKTVVVQTAEQIALLIIIELFIVIASIIWIVYIKKSNRVRNTFIINND